MITIFLTRTLLNLVSFLKRYNSDYATLVYTFPLLMHSVKCIPKSRNFKWIIVKNIWSLVLSHPMKRTLVSLFYRKIGPQWIERSTGSYREDTWSRRINACYCQPGSILFQRRFSKIIWWTQKIAGWKQRIRISKEAKG